MSINIDPVALAIQELQTFGNKEISNELFNDAIDRAILNAENLNKQLTQVEI